MDSDFRRNVGMVPNVASNCSTINGCYGAKTDLHFQSSNYRFVPETDTGGFKAGSNLRPVSVIDPRRDQRQLSHLSGHLIWVHVSAWRFEKSLTKKTRNAFTLSG
jgi:hypothetical protein